MVAEGELNLQETWFDTADARLHRAGFALSLVSCAGRLEAHLRATTDRVDLPDLCAPISLVKSNDPQTALAGGSGELGRRVRTIVGAHPLERQLEIQRSRRDIGLSQALLAGTWPWSAPRAISPTSYLPLVRIPVLGGIALKLELAWR